MKFEGLFFSMLKKTILFGSAFAATAVIFGAMGAHAIKQLVRAELLTTFETAVRFQIYHALAILLVAALADKLNPKLVKPTVFLFGLGILLFSGSLYLLSLRELLDIENYKWLGPITPLGGVCLISGWICLFIGGFEDSTNSKT
jgi:uncharacterized membrane protein YgdD (TMEM256/DUF423 family)